MYKFSRHTHQNELFHENVVYLKPAFKLISWVLMPERQASFMLYLLTLLHFFTEEVWWSMDAKSDPTAEAVPRELLIPFQDTLVTTAAGCL